MILTEWLDEIPDDWACVPAWSLFSERADKAEPDAVHLTPSQAYGVLPQTEYMEIAGSRVVLNLTGADKMKAVYEGDFISHLRSFQGGLEQSSLRGKVSQAYTVLRPSPLVQSGYFRYLMKSRIFIEQLNNLTDQLRDGQTINYARFARMGLPLPPLESQRIIAQYLDHETYEIDAMLAKLDVLNEALTSRRASVVERETIARSGSLTRLKFCADISLGKTFQGVRKSDRETSVNYIRAASIQPSCLELDDQRMWMTREEQRKYDLRKGDVLVVEGGAGFGRSAHLAQDMPGWGFQNHVIRVRPDQHHDGRFLNYCVKGHYSSGLIGLLADGATIPGLSSDKAKNLPIPDMSLEEQKRIADHLDEVTGRIDAMLATIDELKALLVERRAALITDVVTGRKKVPA